jgi:NAD(P)-dependent dehydrogenase (short-subunit alcohol dehydrogenase family)
MQRGTALVTGSSSGFGLLTCVALVQRGFRVWASMRNLERADALREALDASGFGSGHVEHVEYVEYVELDVCNREQADALVERILDKDGAIDVLVNNAGTMVTGFAEEVDEAALREQFEVNFFGHVHLTRALLPAMRARRHGRVINVSSVSGRRGLPDHSAYCASKFALEGWSEALRYEMIPYHVFVSLVEPGMFPSTGIFDRNSSEVAHADSVHAKSRAWLAAMKEKQQGRLAGADPRRVAEVVAEIALADAPRLRYPVGLDAWASALSFGPTVRMWWEQAMIRAFRS